MRIIYYTAPYPMRIRTYFITCVIPLLLFIDRELIMHEVIFDNRLGSEPESEFFLIWLVRVFVTCSAVCSMRHMVESLTGSWFMNWNMVYYAARY